MAGRFSSRAQAPSQAPRLANLGEGGAGEHVAERGARRLAVVGKRRAGDAETERGHQAIPLPSPEVVDQLPMVAQLISQLGLELTSVVRPDPNEARALSQRTSSATGSATTSRTAAGSFPNGCVL